jgi:hypothetical protein
LSDLLLHFQQLPDEEKIVKSGFHGCFGDVWSFQIFQGATDERRRVIQGSCSIQLAVFGTFSEWKNSSTSLI